MFRNSIGSVFTLLLGMLIFVASTAMAKSPQKTIRKRIWGTDGLYFNLKIQEKVSFFFLDEAILTDETSMFADECNRLSIYYVTHIEPAATDDTGKELPGGEIIGLSDEIPAKVAWTYEKEYLFIFGEVRSEPKKEEYSQDPKFKLWYQYSGSDTCNDADPPVPDSPLYPNFPVNKEPPEPSLLTLEPMDVRNVNGFTLGELIGHEAETARGKENLQPPDITRFFKWLGWFFEANIFDADSDGDADAYGFSIVKTY